MREGCFLFWMDDHGSANVAESSWIRQGTNVKSACLALSCTNHYSNKSNESRILARAYMYVAPMCLSQYHGVSLKRAFGWLIDVISPMIG